MHSKHDGTLIDEELKRRLMSKEILAYLASKFVDDFAHMGWRQVLPYLEDPQTGGINQGDRERSGTGHGGIRYDILVRLRSPKGKDKRIGVLLNVEGQNEVRSLEAMKKRMLYYTCRLVGEQKGDIFQNDRYGDLAEVVSVWIFLKPAKTDQGRIVEWSLAGRQLTRLDERRTRWKGAMGGMKIVSVCIPEPEQVQSESVAGLLGVYLDADLPPTERRERLREVWDVDLPSRDEEGKEMFDGAGRDLLRKAEKEGCEEGLKEGLQKGREATLLENIQTLAEGLHLTPEQAMDALKVPPRDRERIRQALVLPKA